MNRPNAASFRVPVIAFLLAFAQLGCGSGSKTAGEPDAVTEAVKAPKAELTPSTTPDIAKAPAQTPTAPAATPTPQPASSQAPFLSPEPPPPAPMPAASEVAVVTDQTKDANAKPPKKDDPLKWLQESEAKKAEYQSKVTEAEGKLAAADATVAEWEKNVMAFRIPYRPRPVLNEKDADAIAGKGAADRVEYGENKLTEARAARDAAQKALDDLKANPPM